MSVIQDIWSGVKSIISGGVKIAVATGKAAWVMLKFACKVALWIVAGVFTMAAAGVDYVISTIKSFFKPKEVIVVGTNQNDAFAEFIGNKIANGDCSEDEEELLVDMKNRCEQAYYNDEILIVAKGVDDNGNETLAEPKFVKADDYDEKIKDADDSGKIYIKKVKIAG